MEPTPLRTAQARHPFRWLALGALTLLLVIAAGAVAFCNNAARIALQSAGRSLGYTLTTGSLDVGLGGAVAAGVRVVNSKGEPVFDARRVAVRYSLRDLLPGGKRLFGLVSVAIDAPHVTVIHHADGTYNITLPASSTQRSRAAGAPLDVALHVGGGSVDLIDRYVAAPRERRQRLVDVNADGAIAARAAYHGGATFVDAGVRYPLSATGRFADARGFEFQQISAARLPVAALADFVLSTRAVVVEAGEIDDLRVKVGALATSAGALQQHFGVAGRLAGIRLAATALAKPVRDVSGAFVVDDDSATLTNVTAAINGVPLRVRGALYHFAAPQVAFAVTLAGDLRRLRELSADVAKLPIAGAVGVQALAEGPAANPLVFARFSAPNIHYAAFRFDRPHGFVAVSGQELDVLAASLYYGAVGIDAAGALRLARHTQTTGFARIAAPANSLPYVDALVPGMALDGNAVVRGTDSRLAARGYLGGSHAGDRLDVPFSVEPAGSGTIGPLVLARHDGASAYGRARFDRGARTTVAVFDARAISLLPAPAIALPGLSVPPLPGRLDGKLDATIAGVATGTSLAGLDGGLHAYGSWGDVRADARATGRRFAARGRLTSSFERLAAFTGNIGAHGGIDIPFAAVNAGRTTLVQIAGARFSNAAIRGIPLSAADATVGVGSGPIDIYSAGIRVAGSNITAEGRFGNGGRVQITASGVDVAALRAAGVPFVNGHATVIADIGGTAAKPVAGVLAALGGARFGNADFGANVGLTYDGATVQLDRATVTFGGAFANAAGTVGGLVPGHFAPRYALAARLEDADIATLARTVKTPLRYPEGTIDANVRVGGAAALPSVNGSLLLPEGSLNGLSFRDGRVDFDGTPAALRADGGRLTVGGTTLDFGARVSRSAQSVRLRTAQLDLADFNDYFDEADVLAGTGRVAVAFDAAPTSLRTSANVALRNVRYRRFALGQANATLSTAASTVHVAANLAGSNGNVSLNGAIRVPDSDPLHDVVRRSYVDVHARIAGINLGNVLPAAGISAPVVGFIDGSAAVRGRYPALALSTHASLVRGVAGRLPIDRLTIAATADNGRGRLTNLTLDAPGLSATADGTFGIRPEDAFALNAHVVSPNINALVIAATGKNPALSGALDTRTHLTGTLARPHLATSIDLDTLTYKTLTIPHVHTDLSATRQSVDVRNGLIRLPRGGAVAFDGRAPLSTRANTPIAFDFAPHGVDVRPYSPLLPDGSVVEGVFDGNVGVRGTLGAPQLSGSLGYSNGSYRSNSLKAPLTAIALQLDFAGTTINIRRLHAHANPGNFDGTGSIAVGDLRNPLPGLRTHIELSASNAVVLAPKLYSGTIDGLVTANKTAGSALGVAGDLTFSKARIPYTALVPSGGTATGPAPVLPDVALNVGVEVGRDVRVQSGPVDIGTTGSARLGGTLAKPTLDGQFTATDGTVSVYRTFVVQNGSTVSFNPADGITPSVDATAVTSISDPATDILLHITGLSTHLNLAFSSQPQYSQQQILGLLVNAQAFGAVSGVATTSGGSSGSGNSAITGIGEGVLNTQFTQKFLQPLSSSLGGALGLSDLNVNYNLNGAVSATARRKLGKNISFTYGEQIGGPTPRTSIGINVGSAISGAQLTIYQAAGSSRAFGGQSLTPYLQSGFLATSPPNYTLQSIEPPAGSGFVFSYQRKFW